MFFSASLPYVILCVFGGMSILKIIAEGKNAFITLLFNIIFGGTLYAILNICKFNIPLNLLSGTCVTLLGVPGVILIIILKLTFNIF